MVDTVCIAGALACVAVLAVAFAVEVRRALRDYRIHSLLPRPVHRAARKTGLR